MVFSTSEHIKIALQTEQFPNGFVFWHCIGCTSVWASLSLSLPYTGSCNFHDVGCIPWNFRLHSTAHFWNAIHWNHHHRQIDTDRYASNTCNTHPIQCGNQTNAIIMRNYCFFVYDDFNEFSINSGRQMSRLLRFQKTELTANTLHPSHFEHWNREWLAFQCKCCHCVCVCINYKKG